MHSSDSNDFQFSNGGQRPNAERLRIPENTPTPLEGFRWKKKNITIYMETADPKLKNRINNLYYSIHSSPTRTSSEVVVYETKITELLEDLETVVGRDSVAAIEKIVEIEYMLNKRNFMIKAKR